MKEPIFSGVCTALVSPFLDGKVNYPMLQQLIRRQMDAGIEAVVICGTTGEAPTLTDEEKLRMFQCAKEYAGNQIKVIAGTGSNSTDHAVWLSKEAEKIGVDALLVVSPYYNKATEYGLKAHYMAIAHSVKIPVILYNVPSRTGVDIPVSVYKSLSRIPNIAGVKEASTDIAKIVKIRAACGDELPVWSGNDDMTVPTTALGGFGVISVLSNVFPAEMSLLANAALAGDYETAAKLQIGLSELNRLLFCEVNPIPVKAAMKIIGYDCGECRLPLCRMTKENFTELEKYLNR